MAKSQWKDENGKPIPETDSRKSVGDFGGMVLVTPDKDWKEKWDKPGITTVPHFREADTVKMGETLTVLIFFSNPAIDPFAGANIEVDLDVIQPDGQSSVHEVGRECFKGKIAFTGEPRRVFLCEIAVAFIAEPTDPLGKWHVKVALRDKNRNAAMNLKTSYKLTK